MPPSPLPRGNLFIAGPAGSLECMVREAPVAAAPGGEAPGVRPLWAVVSHPHPAYGGTLHNKVVYRIASVLGELGWSTLRYNFRGVGNSAGVYDEGRGEADDLRAVLDHLERERGVERVLLAGFSFGAWINARVGCADPRVDRLLHVGITDAFFALDLSGCDKPTAVVQGDRDQFGEWSRALAAVAALPRARLFKVEEADHFFEGRQPELEAALRQAARYLEGGEAG